MPKYFSLFLFDAAVSCYELCSVGLFRQSNESQTICSTILLCIGFKWWNIWCKLEKMPD